MRTSNPVLNAEAFGREGAVGVGESMTIQGAVNKTLLLLLFLIVPAYWVWGMVGKPVMFEENVTISPMVMPLIMGGSIAGFIFALITAFKRQWAGVTAPIYAVCQGLAMGGISAMYELRFQGIVFQAVSLTVATLFCLLLAYKSGLVKATEKFKAGIFAATGAVFLVYMVNMIMGFFGNSITILNSNNNFGILFSVIIVVIAALNLVLDFDVIERGAEQGAPKYMEWYGAFGLMVTLIWLYLEILRLLSKLRSRN